MPGCDAHAAGDDLPAVGAQDDPTSPVFPRCPLGSGLVRIDGGEDFVAWIPVSHDQRMAATSGDLRCLGLALHGDKKTVNKLTGSLPLLR